MLFAPSRLYLCGVGLVASACAVLAADWPQWRGPNRDGITTEQSGRWPPRKLWSKTVANGDSSPIIAAGKIYLTGEDGGKTRVYCLDAETGAQLWSDVTPGGRYGRFSVGDKENYWGPLSTPACDGRLLFTLSVDGDLQCWNASTGAKVWGFNLYDRYCMGRRENIGPDLRDYGYTSGPALHGESIVVGVGGERGCVMAFRKSDGAAIAGWGSGQWGHTGGPATPDGSIYMTLRHLIIGARAIPWQTNFGCNIPTPGVSQHYVVATSDYNINRTTCFDKNGKEIWSVNRCERVSSPVVHEQAGNVYLAGVGIRLSLADGKTKWSFGGCSNVAVTGDGKLIAFDTTIRLYDTSSGAKLGEFATGIERGWPSGAIGGGYLVWKNRNTIGCWKVSSDGNAR